MLAAVKRICDFTEKIVIAVSAFLLVVLAVLVCVQVFARYVLNASVSWIADVTVTLMMWVGLLAAAGCVWTDMHMRLNLILGKIPAPVRIWIFVFIDLLVGAFSAFIFVEGVDLVIQTMGGTMPTLPVPVGVTYLVVPLSAAVMVIFSAMNVVRRLGEHFLKKEADANG